MDVLDYPGFYQSKAAWRAAPETRSYQHQLQRAWNALDLSAVFCIEGRPTILFRQVEQADPKREAEWQRHLWNLGSAAILVVEDPVNTRVYSALAKPLPEPIGNVNADDRLAESLKSAVLALELRQFLLSVQTGQFYRDRQKKFRPEVAVDQ
jgi:hypothetical protein